MAEISAFNLAIVAIGIAICYWLLTRMPGHDDIGNRDDGSYDGARPGPHNVADL